jgi:integrase/recombinase XerD
MNVDLWPERFEEYMQARNFSPRTVEAYRGEVRTFLAFLEPKGLLSLASLTRGHLEEYRLHLFYLKPPNKDHLSAKTQSTRITAVRRFVRFLVREDYLLIDVGADMEMPRVPDSLPRVVLSEQETVRLIEAPDTSTKIGIRDRAVLELLYGTALRNSELGSLVLDQVDWDNHCLRIWHGKGDKPRVVPMGEEAELWLQEYLTRVRPGCLRDPEQKAVFLTNRGRPFKRESLADVVIRWAKKIGLDKPVTPHTLRHCCATHMLRRGASLRHIQAILGHSSPETTERYTRVEVSDLRKVVMRCHPRERPS